MTGALVNIGYKTLRALIVHPEVWAIAIPILAVTAVAYGVEQHRENVAKAQADASARLSE
jgi:hypothetical protein